MAQINSQVQWKTLSQWVLPWVRHIFQQILEVDAKAQRFERWVTASPQLQLLWVCSGRDLQHHTWLKDGKLVNAVASADLCGPVQQKSFCSPCCSQLDPRSRLTWGRHGARMHYGRKGNQQRQCDASGYLNIVADKVHHLHGNGIPK